jgi:serine/threonine protein kinase
VAVLSHSHESLPWFASLPQWRAPEEYFDDPLDEKIDIFSLGNNLYSILTGLSPFYTLKSKEAVEKVKRGEKPYIDPRWRNHSFAEGKIVELIERCYPFKAEDRIDIFQTVQFLRDAVHENERRKGRKRGA